MAKRVLERVEIGDEALDGCYAVSGFTREGRYFMWMRLDKLSVPDGLARRHTGKPHPIKRSLDTDWGRWFLIAVQARIRAENLVEAHASRLAARQARELAEAAAVRRRRAQETAGPALYQALVGVRDTLAAGRSIDAALHAMIAEAIARAEEDT